MQLWQWFRTTPMLSDKLRLELYPLFFVMRVKVLELSGNWEIVRLRLPLKLINRNIGGGMFGGSQAAVADPIAALACVKRFPGYAVWTRSLELDFRREGLSDLELRFEFSQQKESKILADLAVNQRSTPIFEYGFYDPDGKLCTHVSCSVAIRPRGYKVNSDGIG